MPRLNAKQLQFCHEYLIDSNATRAATRAGYSAKTAYSIGQRLLKHVDVAKEIKRLRDASWKTLGMERDEVIARLARIARFDPRKIVDDKGGLKPSSEWDDDTAAAIGGVDFEERVERTGGGRDDFAEVRLKKVRTRDTVKALELLGRVNGIFEQDNKQSRPVLFDVVF